MIPDGEILFRYVKPDALPAEQKEIPTSIFNDKELSCDWEKYQKEPEGSHHIKIGNSIIVEVTVCEAIKNPQNPKRTGEIVPAWKQEVIHDPLEDIEGNDFTPNESHSLIKGKKKAAVTSAIRDNSKIRS